MKPLFILFIALGSIACAQIPVLQEFNKGGFFVEGISFGQSYGEAKIPLHYPVNAVNKRLYLLCYSERNPDSSTIQLNGWNLTIEKLKGIVSVQHKAVDASPITIFFTDITPYFNVLPDTLNYKIGNPCQDIINCGFFEGVFFGTYDLPGQTNTTLVNITIPDKDLYGYEKFIIENLSVKSPNSKLAFAIGVDRACYSGPPDSTYVYINNNLIGGIAGQDNNLINNGWCAGVQGNFIFENDQFTALNDDNIDEQLTGTDGVSNLENLLPNPQIPFEIFLEHWRYFAQSTPPAPNEPNTNLFFAFAYTTPCDTFSVTVSSDTVVCKNEPLQLSVLGGNRYDWSPKLGLSCYDCPNPILSTDSSRFYTVRIWNNDSCSVTRPVHVKVRELPKFNSASSSPTNCADSTGSILVTKHASVLGAPLWSLDGGPFEMGSATLKTYENLPEGTYTITLKDDNGCTRDTSLMVGFTIPTKASFVVNPEEGASPLEVSVNNTSQNYTNSEWFLQGFYIDTSLSQLFLDTSGLYTLQLISWYKDPKCADTAERTIYVYEDFVVSVPNVFSPNQDGVNEQFGVSINQPATVNFKILNRWGQVIHAQDNLKAIAGFLPLWAGNDMAEGVYFYQIIVTPTKATEPQELTGFFHLER